jgi:thiol-disulfide isomerase/thioredoxin
MTLHLRIMTDSCALNGTMRAIVAARNDGIRGCKRDLSGYAGRKIPRLALAAAAIVGLLTAPALSDAQVLRFEIRAGVIAGPQAAPDPAALAVDAPPVILPAQRLQMSNGDFYAGRLADSDKPGVLAWQSDVAVAPFLFELAAINVAHFARGGAAAQPTGEFCVELVGGDALFGTLAGLTAEVVELQTKAFGRLRIDRSIVQRVLAWDDQSGIAYLGPNGLEGWLPLDAARPWREDAGQLLTDKSSALAAGSIPIPPQASVEVELSWEQRADFSIHFGNGPGAKAAWIRAAAAIRGRPANNEAGPDPPAEAFELAVWGDSVVLVRESEAEADLAVLQPVKAGPGRLSLRLHYDQAAGVVSAYTFEGKLLASVKTASASSLAASGVKLVNRNGDLRLERLLIRRWGGDTPAQLAADQSYLQLREGAPIPANGATFDAEQSEFVVTVDSDERRIPLKDVLAMNMPRVTRPDANAEPSTTIRLSLHDGARLNGELQRVTHGRLHIARTGVAEELRVPIEGVQSIVVLKHGAVHAQSAGRAGRLEALGSASHGMLVDAPALDDIADDAACLAWLPFGSSTSSPLRADLSGRIIYRAPPRVVAQANPVRVRPGVRAPVRQPEPGLWNALLDAYQKNTPAQTAAARPAELAEYGELLWLRAGDRIPCRIESIDDRGVTFKTPLLDATFVPHDAVKAWDFRAGTQPRSLEDVKRARLLTLPRMQRENPPRHLIESLAGDFLRGRVESMDEKVLRIEVRLETREIPRHNIARIIWLSEDPDEDDDADAEEAAHDAATIGDGAPPPASKLQVQAVCNNGVRLTFHPEQFAAGVLTGASALLGACSVPVADIDQLYVGDAIADAAQALDYSTWRLHAAADPRFITEDGKAQPTTGVAGLESALVGQIAPDFTLELAGGGKFRLSEQRGRVVVLDFWATWCAWCMQSMPDLDKMAADFGDDITWIAVNLQEDSQTVAAALERLGITPRTALDVDGAAAEKFGVTAIPQTVVIDAEGKVTRVFIGGGPNFVDQLRAAIAETLGDHGKREP